MPHLERYSIRNRILLTILFTSIMVILFLTWVLVYENRTQKELLVDRTRAMAQFIGADAASDLQSGNKATLEKAIEKIRGHMGIDTVYIFDATGDLFLAYPTQSALSTPYGWVNRRADFTEDALHVVEPITRENQVVGSVYLRVPTQNLNQRMKRYSLILISYMIAVLLISVFLVLQIHKTISVPLGHLARTIRDVPESVSFQVDSGRVNRDEITDLYSGFDKMLRKIERRGEQRDRAETAFEESERRYRNLVESSPDAIFVQQNGKIVYINAAGLNLFGISSPENIIGKEIHPYLSFPENISSQPFETRLVRADERICDVDVTFVEITHEQAPAIQVIVRDVTERKHLRETAERMKRLAAIGELSAHIAHEIRNSIASLQLNLENLAKHTKGTLEEKIISNMLLGIQRMSETVTSILNFAKPNPPTMKKMPVKMVLESALKMAEKELYDSHIEVVCSFDDSCAEVLMDPNQMNQAFLNLFRNSCEAMISGGILSIQTKRIDDSVEIELADTGEGISTNDIDRIFDPFFTTKHHGTGLGLAFVARTIEQHGASIFVESMQKAGTKFFIRFPLNQR